MKIPEAENTTQSLIDKAHEARKEKPRPHLGCSMLGHACDRWIWLSFRWAVQEEFPGRILRLFRRGQNEEVTIISDLRAAGMDVRGTQDRVDFGGHVSGSLDAIIESGVPEAPKKRHIAEFKTHSLKSFNDLEKKGVKESKPMHYVQMQTYMMGKEIGAALYLAVCKDDDRIYTERVKYDADVATKAVARGHRIAISDRIPEPLSNDETWYECRFCAGHDFCFGSKTTKHVNCRTCAHSTPLSDSTWHCAKWDDLIPTQAQHQGCESHALHPDLVPWKRKDSPDEWTAVYEINGQEVRNGEPGDGVFGSKELLANPAACADAGWSQLHDMRKQFNGRIVG